MNRGHNSSARPDSIMSRPSWYRINSKQKRVQQKQANAKRRWRDRVLSRER